MKRMWLLLVLAVLCVSVSMSQIPRTIGYQGVLTDSLGNPKIDGSYSMSFKLYDVQSGGASLWGETKLVDVKRGLFNTNLGDNTAFGSSVKFDKRYWLGISVSGGPELTPRLPLNSVGYSLNSLSADSALYLKSTQAVSRTIYFNAASMNYSASSAVVSQASSFGLAGGLQWIHSATDGAFLALPRPVDWNGSSDVTIALWFSTTTTNSGTVNFFVRPRTYASGDSFLDATGTAGTAVSVSGGTKIYELKITVAASRFGSKPYWALMFQREQTVTTYADAVIVSSISLSYDAVR